MLWCMVSSEAEDLRNLLKVCMNLSLTMSSTVVAQHKHLLYTILPHGDCAILWTEMVVHYQLLPA